MSQTLREEARRLKHQYAIHWGIPVEYVEVHYYPDDLTFDVYPDKEELKKFIENLPTWSNK